MQVRTETPDDREAVRAVNEAAFGRPDEAELVERLRSSGDLVDRLCFVAEIDHRVVGHIAHSRITIEPDGDPGLALAPVAVLPAYQGRGVGSALIRHSLGAARDLGEPFVVVLGHSGYYPRFGFEPANNWGIAAPWDVAPEVWMVKVLKEGHRPNPGTVTYPDPFG